MNTLEVYREARTALEIGNSKNSLPRLPETQYTKIDPRDKQVKHKHLPGETRLYLLILFETHPLDISSKLESLDKLHPHFSSSSKKRQRSVEILSHLSNPTLTPKINQTYTDHTQRKEKKTRIKETIYYFTEKLE